MRIPIQILLYIYLCLYLGAETNAQESLDPEALIAKAYELSDSNPAQSLKIGEHLSKNASSDLQRCEIALMMAKSWFNKGQYGNSLTALFSAKELAEKRRFYDQLHMAAVLIASNLRILQLEGQSKRYLRLADREEVGEGKSAIQKQILIDYLSESALLASNSGNSTLALRELDNLKKIVKTVSAQNQDNIVQLYFIVGKIHVGQRNYEAAAASFSNGLKMLGEGNGNSYRHLAMANELAAAYFQQKRHHEAIQLLLNALPVAEQLEHFRFQETINRNLALNYLALKNRERYLFYNKRHLTFDDVADTLESESTNVAFSLISLDQEAIQQFKRTLYAKYTYGIIAIAFFFVLCMGFVFTRNRLRINRLLELQKYLQDEKKLSELASITVKKEPSRQLTIPSETEQYLLGRLKKFESSGRFTNKEMSLAVLAAEFNTNTKYLSEIINKHSGENFNTYINKLRIAYIVDKIKYQPRYRNYKIKYLADESGFSSHSSFATTFKLITGISPTTFIELSSANNMENTPG